MEDYAFSHADVFSGGGGAGMFTGRGDQNHDIDVVALARKLTQTGVLRDTTSGFSQDNSLMFDGAESGHLGMGLVNRNINATRSCDSGRFGRPRNQSLPMPLDAVSPVKSNSAHWSNHCVPQYPPRRMDNTNRNRNPYAPSAGVMDFNNSNNNYQENCGPGMNPAPVNPYAPNAMVNPWNGHGNNNNNSNANGRYTSGPGSYNNGAMNRMSFGGSGGGRGGQRGNWSVQAAQRANELRRNPNNPLMHPPTTTDFFARCRAIEVQQELDIVRSVGEYGPSAGQFNMPQGLCLGMEDEIIVADTLNHRIQFFNKFGEFEFMWGCPGVLNGHLWHPRKVAYIPETEHVVISDRVNGCSRIQIFDRKGKFLKALGNLHGLRMALNTTTAGLTVYKKQIIVVEVQPSACVMLNEDGSVVHWFSLDGVMVEPSDIVVIHGRYYISDFRDHCVCVFNNWGHLIQRLTGMSEGVIRYPRGLGVSAMGHLLVADTDQNRFHISVWDSENFDLVSYHGLNDIKFSHSCGVVMNSAEQIITAVKKDHMVIIMKFGRALPVEVPRPLAWNVNAPSFCSRVEENA